MVQKQKVTDLDMTQLRGEKKLKKKKTVKTKGASNL